MRKERIAVVGVVVLLLATPVLLAAKKFAGLPGGFTTYSSDEFTITGAQSDYNVATSQAGSFTTPAERIIVRSDADIEININAAANDAITLTAAEGVFDSTTTMASITNVFITTTGSSAIKILRFPKSGD